MDTLLLEYKLKRKEISREQLKEAENWSNSTLLRKLAGTSVWTVPELEVLRNLGFSERELLNIFFNTKVS